LTFAIALSPFCFAQPSADEIIAKYVNFIGGESQWKGLRSMYISGTYNYGGLKFDFVSYALSPNLYKYIVKYNGKRFVQSFDGKNGWKIDGFSKDTTRKILKGSAGKEMANEADVEFLPPFINYKKRGFSVWKDGIDTVEEKICYKLKLVRNGHDTSTFSFDTTSGALLKKRTRSSNTELDKSMIDIFYSNYKENDGYKVPFQWVVKTNDQTILTILVNMIYPNLYIKKSQFKN